MKTSTIFPVNIDSRYRKFLERLKQARHEAGLTQVQVAVKLRCPQSFVSKCESGERRVDIVELQGNPAAFPEGQKLRPTFVI